MAKHVEKLEKQIEKMNKKFQNKAVEFGTSESQLSPLAIRSKPAGPYGNKQKEIGKAFVNFIENTYVGNFQRPLNEHRQEQIQRNTHRIDYINLQALGMIEMPVQTEQQ